jgi:hypothetical protein
MDNVEIQGSKPRPATVLFPKEAIWLPAGLQESQLKSFLKAQLIGGFHVRN